MREKVCQSGHRHLPANGSRRLLGAFGDLDVRHAFHGFARPGGWLARPVLCTHLTEPFQRGTDRVRSDQAGAGLGLAIVRSIVQAHDGTLTVTARPDGGLRVSAGADAAPNDPASPTMPARRRSGVPGPIRGHGGRLAGTRG
ncbi:ATP-binding protein [Arthrobacter gallicola]|uniref:ATP-binding protein n=1 Tax=Arthrobacter gallicola TaxID=2762225 RepID=UPI0038503432